jgi:hypothetical protein
MNVMEAATAVPVDLSSLSLDAAIQLDRLAHHKPANLSLIADLAKRLGSPSAVPENSSLLCLQENPVNVDIFNSALSSNGAHIQNIEELEAKVREVILRINEVAAGQTTEPNLVSGLKRFCLSLHRVLLDEIAPKVDHDEWMPIQNARFT